VSGIERVIAMIPAREGSTRLPRKALLAETGKALIVHVCEAAARCAVVERVVAATDSEEIARVVRGAGFEAVLTGEHENGTSRIDEAAEKVGVGDERLIVNVQGDEPEIEGEVVEAAVGAMRAGGRELEIGTAACAIGDAREFENPNVVKVVRGEDGRALYFSRSAIPHGEGVERLRHVGIYAYRRGTLRRYVRLTPTRLDRAEKLEQLRALAHGWGIGVGVVRAGQQGIDTREQYEAFVGRWSARAR